MTGAISEGYPVPSKSEKTVTSKARFSTPLSPNVDSIVLGQAAGVEHVSFYSRTVHLISSYNEP